MITHLRDDYIHHFELTGNNYQVYLSDEINFIDDQPILNYSLRREDADENGME